MLKSVLGTSCDVDRLVPWLRRGPVRVPLFPPVFVGLKCAQASRVSVYLSAFTFLSVVFIDFLASLLFCFLYKAGGFVGSSIAVPPVFPFFSPCLPCPFVFSFVFCLFSFSPFYFSFFCFCIYYEFILAEDLCVHFPLLLISLSFSGGFLVEEFFFFFFFNLF